MKTFARVVSVDVALDKVKAVTHAFGSGSIRRRNPSAAVTAFLRSDINRTTLGDMGLHGLHVRKHRSREHPPFGSSHLSSRDGANFGQPMVKSCPQERESKPFGKSRSLWEREQGSGCRETGTPPFTLFAAYGSPVSI